jgi:hypothetical protein
MPDAGRTHGPPATKMAGGSHHRFSRNNRRIQTVVATPRFLESAHEMWKFRNGSDLLRVLEDCPAVEF